MNVGLYRSAAALQTQQTRIDSIARNLANLSTAGYKRGTAAVSQFEVPGSHGKQQGVAIDIATDFTQGDLTRTGRTFDFALVGGGFFGAEAPEGEVYTRDGTFRLSPEGVLLTAEGYPVAWTSIDRQIDPAQADLVKVDQDGNVRQGLEQVGRLKVIDFEDNQRLIEGSSGYWRAPADLAEATATAQVHQGAIEDSNSTGIGEMVDMIATQRQFDSMARAMKSIQDSYSRLTRPV